MNETLTPAKDIQVRCLNCNWQGTMDELVCKYIPNPDPTYLGDVVGEVSCPICGNHSQLDWKEVTE